MALVTSDILMFATKSRPVFGCGCWCEGSTLGVNRLQPSGYYAYHQA